LSAKYNDLPAELQEYVFDWSDLEITAGKNMQAIAMGYGGMYNSDNPANMRCESVAAGSYLLQKFIADRRINAGDELTINYSGRRGAARSEGNRWFEGRGVTPIFSTLAAGQDSGPRDAVRSSTAASHKCDGRLDTAPD
jgi:hypothetical protein